MIGLGLWLAQGCLLSLVGRFRALSLLGSSLVLVVVVLAATRHHPLGPSWTSRPSGADLWRRFRVGIRQPIAFGTLLPHALCGLCLLYSVAALSVLPVSNHDALSYHYPKAVWLTPTGAFGLYPSQDLRVTYFPGNYRCWWPPFSHFCVQIPRPA